MYLYRTQINLVVFFLYFADRTSQYIYLNINQLIIIIIINILTAIGLAPGGSSPVLQQGPKEMRGGGRRRRRKLCDFIQCSVYITWNEIIFNDADNKE